MLRGRSLTVSVQTNAASSVCKNWVFPKLLVMMQEQTFPSLAPWSKMAAKVF